MFAIHSKIVFSFLIFHVFYSTLDWFTCMYIIQFPLHITEKRLLGVVVVIEFVSRHFDVSFHFLTCILHDRD